MRRLAWLLFALAFVAAVGGPVYGSPTVVVGGDVQGPAGATTVTAIRNASVPTPTNGPLCAASGVLTWGTCGGGGGSAPSGTGVAHVTSGSFDPTALNGSADQLFGVNHAGTDAFFTVGGDGTIINGVLTVTGLRSNAFPTLAAGFLQWTGSAFAWSTPSGSTPTGTGFFHVTSGTADASARAVNLASSDVTGLLPVANVAPGSAAQILVTNSGATAPAWVTASGDWTITAAGVATVAKANGASIPVAGALTTGNVLQVTGASALSYGVLNLGGGASFVTGSLPLGNESSPTLTGFAHVTSGSWDGTARAVSLSSADVSGQLGVANGGTGVATLTAHGVLLGEGTGNVASTVACTAGQLVVGQGATSDPACETVSGDLTCAASGACTFATVNSNVGTFGSATQVAQVTVNAKGLVTAVSNVTITGSGNFLGPSTKVAAGGTANLSSQGAGKVQSVQIAIDGTSGETINFPNPAADQEVVWIHLYAATPSSGTSVVTFASAQSGTKFEDPQNPGDRSKDANPVTVSQLGANLAEKYDSTDNLWSEYQ